MLQKKETVDLIFESSWEVCNKVGGIYTVLSSKANTLQSLYKDKVIFIGPDVWTKDNPSPYFKESKALLKGWKTNANLPEGVSVRVGRWNIPGNPIVILVDYKSLYERKNQLYAAMWENFRVDSLHAYGDYDESCMFAYGAGLVIESIMNWQNNKKANSAAIAHFDEWTTGMGLLYVKMKMPNVATVFTTHATSIGRSICGNNKPLYDYLHNYNGDQMAQQLNMQSKHSLEKAAAHFADSFTTVSSVTDAECEQLLEKKTDVVTPNGIETDFVPTAQKYPAARKKARKVLLNVASKVLGQEVSEDAFLIATSGRNEFRNKGIDLFIDSMNKIRNEYTDSNRMIIAFVMVPAWVAGPRADLVSALENNSNETIQDPIITHYLHNYSEDSIVGKIHYLGMHNAEHENVKVIYVPSYLNGNDGIFNMSYYDLILGMDLTAFPSYYEPWGYTPLESIAFSVPTITTDLSGFGQWVLSNFENDFKSCGVKVLHRTDSNYFQVVDELANSIISLVKTEDKDINKIRKSAKTTSLKTVWSKFMEQYIEAYSIALNKVNKSHN